MMTLITDTTQGGRGRERGLPYADAHYRVHLALTLGEATRGDGRGLRTVRHGGRVVSRDESAEILRRWLNDEPQWEETCGSHEHAR